MEKTFKVPNVGCDGCVNTIKAELGDLAGVKSVDGVVDTKMVTVDFESPIDWNDIVAILEEIDYAPEQD